MHTHQRLEVESKLFKVSLEHVSLGKRSDPGKDSALSVTLGVRRWNPFRLDGRANRESFPESRSCAPGLRGR